MGQSVSVSQLVTDWLVILFSTFESKTVKMRTPAIIFVIFPILNLVHSANIGGRDGEDPDQEEPTSDVPANMVPLTLGLTGRSLPGLGRAAAIGNQEEAAGSQTLPNFPPGVPPLPFFNRPPTNSVTLPGIHICPTCGGSPCTCIAEPAELGEVVEDVVEDVIEDVEEDLEDELCVLIQRLIRKYSRRQIQQHCPAKPPSCNPKLFSKCQCTSPAKYSPEGFGNCNFGASKADKRVWCYVEHKFGDPRNVCPDAIASVSNPGWYWSRMACLT